MLGYYMLGALYVGGIMTVTVNQKMLCKAGGLRPFYNIKDRIFYKNRYCKLFLLHDTLLC